ncbi:MAG: TlpA family protein disulfide reductase [Planctomycetaceae bacterium]|nr:TlpA family protein disulfide reductase [Planctomycetaceae bacterium]
MSNQIVWGFFESQGLRIWLCFACCLGLLWMPLMPSQSLAQGSGQEVTQDENKALTEAEVNRELNRLLQDETAGVPRAIEYLNSVLDRFPAHSDLHLLAISLHSSHGVQLLAEQQIETGHAAIRRAAALAKVVLADPKHLSAIEPEFAELFFHAAQTYATDKQPDLMYAALDQACELGFDNWSAIHEAKPMLELLEQPEFQAYLEKQKALVPQRLAIRLRQELKTFESFEFDFDLKSVSGEPVVKNQWKGKLLVVDVWGTWCPPCRKSLPHLIELQNEFGDQGVQVVGLNVENEETVAEQTATVKAAIQSFGINYPCAVIDEPALTQIPNFEGFPTTLLIDRSGQVRLKLVGQLSAARLKAAVEILLEETPSSRP